MLQILRNAQLFSPTPLGIRDLVVSAGEIVWIGEGLPRIDSRLIEKETDLAEARVIPGFIDCHVHLTGGGGESGPASKVPPVPLSRFTRGGTTSVVGVLGTDDLTRSTASLVVAARGLIEEGNLRLVLDRWLSPSADDSDRGLSGETSFTSIASSELGRSLSATIVRVSPPETNYSEWPPTRMSPV